MSTIAGNDFSQGSVPKTITRLALPLIGAEIVNALYNVVDRIYIARIPGMGSLALTGVGVCFPFVMIISAFAQLGGMGGAPLLSIARGEGDYAKAKRIQGNALVLLVAFSIAITVVTLLLKGQALYWFGASVDTFASANEYLTVYVLGSPFVLITLGMNSYINAQGYARTGMFTVLIGAVLNIVLDPIFIFTFGMGVRGAALATVLSQAVSALWVMRFLTGKHCMLKVERRDMRPDFSLMRSMLGLGFASFIMNVNDSLVSIVCNAQLQRFGGDVYVGVMTVISSLRQVLYLPMSGFSQGSMPVIGYNYGAGLYRRVRQAILFTLTVCVAFATSVWAAAELLPGALMRIFTSDEALIAAGIPCCRIYFALFMFMSLQMAGQRGFVALGRAKKATLFSILRKALIVAPLALILPGMGLGAHGVFLAEPVSDFIGPVACFTTFMLTEWRLLREPGEKKEKPRRLRG